MLRKVLFSFAVSFISVSVSAQIQYIIGTGLNASNIRSAQIDSNKTVLGPTFSFAAIIPVGTLQFKPEVQYSQRGYVIKTGNVGGNINFSSKFKQVINYIEVPLEIVYPVKTGSGHFMIAAGPVIGFALSGKTTTTLTLVGNRDEKVKNIDFGSGPAQLKSLDYGGRINLMYVFNGGLLLKADYNYGFSNLSNNNTEQYNTSIGLGIGYVFGSKKK
ncbi:MAG: PorT family protein [Chitinophagaceae bacterium]|nr:PorT family protein [Chitinophagaceae bacterium]